MSIYVIAFLITLIPAVLVGIWRGGNARVIALVIGLSFVLSHLSWVSNHPLYSNTLSDLVCAAIILLYSNTQRCLYMAYLFIIAVMVSMVNGILIAPSIEHSIFTAWVLSILGHFQNIYLYWIKDDDRGGKRIYRRIWDLGISYRRA